MATTVERSNQFKRSANRVNRSRKRKSPMNSFMGSLRQLRQSNVRTVTLNTMR